MQTEYKQWHIFLFRETEVTLTDTKVPHPGCKLTWPGLQEDLAVAWSSKLLSGLILGQADDKTTAFEHFEEKPGFLQYLVGGPADCRCSHGSSPSYLPLSAADC